MDIIEKKTLPLGEIKAGDDLHYLRQFDNLYVPFGTKDVRMVEDIDTKPPYDNIYIRTDGLVVLEVFEGPPEEKSFWYGAPKGKKKKEAPDEEQISL